MSENVYRRRSILLNAAKEAYNAIYELREDTEDYTDQVVAELWRDVTIALDHTIRHITAMVPVACKCGSTSYYEQKVVELSNAIAPKTGLARYVSHKFVYVCTSCGEKLPTRGDRK